VRGAHAVLELPAEGTQYKDFLPGAALQECSSPTFHAVKAGKGRLVFDVAALGAKGTLQSPTRSADAREIATFRFSASDPTAIPRLIEAALRDVENAPMRSGPSAAERASARPADDAGLWAWPNPFGRSVELRYVVTAAGTEATLSIFDVGGRHVRTFRPGIVAAGRHRETWDGRDARGAPAPAGVYLCRLRAGGTERAIKLYLAR
jgi:hypothetical protein